MAMEVDEPGSDFGSDKGHPSSGKKTAISRGRKAAPATIPRKNATRSRRKGEVSRALASAFTYDLRPVEAESDGDGDENDEEMGEDEVPKSTRRTNRTTAPRFVFRVPSIASVVKLYENSQKSGKKAPANKLAQAPTKTKQSTLNFTPSGTTSGRTSTRAAAGRARGKVANIVSLSILFTALTTKSSHPHEQIDVESD
jgi:double-strand break repair protein MRE11